MARPNIKFDLTVEDLERIEGALRAQQADTEQDERKEINELLGRLHNQKTFFRPNGTYVGG